MQLSVAEEGHAGKLPGFRFCILDELLKELNFDKSAATQLMKKRESEGLNKGYVVCPNKGVRKYWWATKQETRVRTFAMIDFCLGGLPNYCCF